MPRRRRLGPAKGDRVNFPHHNERAIVMPEQQRRDPDAVPAHAREHIPWPGESLKEERAREAEGRSKRGEWNLPERETCSRCGARPRKKVGGLYSHHIPGTTTGCSWNT